MVSCGSSLLCNRRRASPTPAPASRTRHRRSRCPTPRSASRRSRPHRCWGMLRRSSKLEDASCISARGWKQTWGSHSSHQHQLHSCSWPQHQCSQKERHQHSPLYLIGRRRLPMQGVGAHQLIWLAREPLQEMEPSRKPKHHSLLPPVLGRVVGASLPTLPHSFRDRCQYTQHRCAERHHSSRHCQQQDHLVASPHVPAQWTSS
mmetsp:Transcript_89871/g.169371  ORF Transcript_89871/g.169371 Transcript_89871/m.169371 type:complete len:204 (+) Transcript_89871:35-646(+)